jgi:hypothetical protein
MSFERDEALAKVGKRVQLHDFEDDSLRTSFSEDVPAGTTDPYLTPPNRPFASTIREAVEARIPWYHPEEHKPHGAIR